MSDGPLTRAELRRWAEMRHHFDATRELRPLGDAVLSLLAAVDAADERAEDWMRRGLAAVERADGLRRALDELAEKLGGAVGDRARQAVAADDAAIGGR